MAIASLAEAQIIILFHTTQHALPSHPGREMGMDLRPSLSLLSRSMNAMPHYSTSTYSHLYKKSPKRLLIFHWLVRLINHFWVSPIFTRKYTLSLCLQIASLQLLDSPSTNVMPCSSHQLAMASSISAKALSREA